jgi:hypothetical protein
MYPVCRQAPCCSPCLGGYRKLLLPAALIAAGLMLAAVGMFRVDGDRIVLRDTTEALSFVQELVDLMGMILPR